MSKASKQVAQSGYPFSRLLMWLHLAYLVLLPLGGLAALTVLKLSSGVANLAGWIPAVVYVAFLLTSYRLTVRPIKALLVVALVPGQIAFYVTLLGEDIWLFLLEDAAVELVALSLAVTIAMARYRPSGWSGVIVGVLITLAAVAGFGVPLFVSIWEHGPLWMGLLGVTMLSGVWAHLQLVLPAARDRLGGVPEKGPRYGQSDLLDRLLGKDRLYVEPGASDGLKAGLILGMIAIWLALPWLIKLALK